VQNPEANIVRDHFKGGIDLVLTRANGERLGIDVKLVTKPGIFNAKHATRRAADHAVEAITSRVVDRYLLCVVTTSRSDAEAFRDYMGRISLPLAPLNISIGHIREGVYEEILRIETAGRHVAADDA
jgi:hypothetical protein